MISTTLKYKMKFHILIVSTVLSFYVSCTNDIKKNNDIQYGSFLKKNGVEFKLYAPNSSNVELIIFEKFDDNDGLAYQMTKDDVGNWKLYLEDQGVGTMYGYRLEGPFNNDSLIIADPYSKAAITQNTWRHVAKTLVIDESFEWEGDTWQNMDPTDLVIYEAHLRDMTRHPSSKAKSPGTYKGFIEPGQKGGTRVLKTTWC